MILRNVLTVWDLSELLAFSKTAIQLLLLPLIIHGPSNDSPLLCLVLLKRRIGSIFVVRLAQLLTISTLATSLVVSALEPKRID